MISWRCLKGFRDTGLNGLNIEISCTFPRLNLPQKHMKKSDAQSSMTDSLYTSIKVENTHEISLQWLDSTLYFCIAFFYFKNNRFLTDLQFEWNTYIVTPIECCCNVIFGCSFLMHFELKIYDTLKKELCDLMKNWKCCGHTMSHSIQLQATFSYLPKTKPLQQL